MKKILALAVAIAAITLVTGVASAAGAIPRDVARWNEPGFQKRAIALLEVQPNGTVRVNDWKAAKKLFGAQFAWAMNDLETWNQKVRSGEQSGFKTHEELANSAIVLDEAWLARAQAVPSTEVIPVSTAPYCRGGWIGQCLGNTCCCGGWWFFCTQYCSPCRYK